MSIFEDLENLNVSEECFNNIVDIIEEYINELELSVIDRWYPKRAKNREETHKKAATIGYDDNTNVEELDKAAKDAEEKEKKARKLLNSWALKVKGLKTDSFDDNGVYYTKPGENPDKTYSSSELEPKKN